MKATSKTPRKRTAATRVAAVKAPRTASKRYFYSFDDPLGSYTGTPEDIGERPMQDADDL